MKKRFLVILSVVLMLCLSVFAGCGNDNNNNNDNGNGKIDVGDAKEYVFEAEDTDLTGKTGSGWSGTNSEEGMIVSSDDCKASNGRFLCYLYDNGTKLDFVINSTEAVENVTLVLRLSCEFKDMTFTPANYSVKLTHEGSKFPVDINYPKISLKCSGSNSKIADFNDYVASTTVSLVKGTNTITLTTNNTESFGGTTKAIAPLVDCIKLYVPSSSNAVLSMEKAENY